MSAPKSCSVSMTPFSNRLPLLIHGQGVFLFEAKLDASVANFYIVDKTNEKGLYVEFAKGRISVISMQTFEPYVDHSNTQGLISSHGAYYWFSLDSHNRTLYAGVGEPRLETLLYQYTFSPLEQEFLESLVAIRATNANPKQLLRDPITRRIPLLIKHTDELSMLDIASGTYLPSANLSPASQILYNCISGKRFVLDDEDFPEFSQAIEHSLRTPGCWCNRRILEKATEFDKDHPQPLETYLRITLGGNNGESPGVPYVMEIWPVGHYSPIHSHANANAIIRVLHGSIHVELFPFLCDDSEGIKEFAAVDFKKDDITWISPTLNQVHRLTNLPTNTETCITIQCYMYDADNSAHYDYFDYLDGDGRKQQYTPDSDMDFVAFKETMKREWVEFQRTRYVKHLVYRPSN